MTTPMNVYEALQKRLKKIFERFDYVYIAFSGGKDSGVLLCACIEYVKEHYPGRKIGIFHLDYEIQYSETINYVDRVFESNRDILEIYRICVPVKVPTSTSMFQTYWRPWDPAMKHLWIRELPTDSYTKEKFDFYTEEMWDYELNKQFALWIKKKKGVRRIACLIGIRTQESYNRWRMIYAPYRSTPKRSPYWTHQVEPGIYNVYPIFDWLTTDIWTANGKFNWDYNRLYDLYFKAGVPLESQRVASPFILPGQKFLKLYRAIDPNTWGKMLCRVNGVNFTSIYGGTHAMGWHHLKLPPNMTWKEYMYFLLDTLPEKTRDKYLEKLRVSIHFWRDKGGCLDRKTIDGLIALEIPITIETQSNYVTRKSPVRMEYQDDIPLPAFKELPTYKRVCICILKNDHCCKFMGFSPNKSERDQRLKIEKTFSSFFIKSINDPLSK